ncbi:Thioredoxin [Macleaya cordata]|uniref:protein disulfide-isomerase n=1 Tax=Macleaya cordata TaxID=56857 RepID=A0A200R5W4_MACCD|nr:Thioredoxin [Macleaya cordata]
MATSTMVASRVFIVLSISSVLLINNFCSSSALSKESSKLKDVDDDDDDLENDLKFLAKDDDEQAPISETSPPFPEQFNEDDDEDEDENEDFEGSDGDQEQYSLPPEVDEKDVVVLKQRNFSKFVKKNPFVMVEFYAPWCGHCQDFAPEYAAAATELKGKAVLAKVDATEENELAEKYEIQGFPTVFFFVDGVHRLYHGQNNKDAIVAWVKKKTGPGIHNITTTKDAERTLNTENKLVMGFLDSLVGPESDALAAAARLEDDVNFYQTSNPEVAKLFLIDLNAKRPALVLLKNEAEKLSHFNGQFTKSAITEFVLANKLPLVTRFTRENAPMIFENPIKKQVLLFATSSGSGKILPAFGEAAKFFKGKLIFVYVEIDDIDVGRPVSHYFGVNGDGPKVIAHTGSKDAKKYVFDDEVTFDSIKAFGKDFLEGKLKPFYKSDPIPEINDGDVKIVVGNNFDEIILDESKDVLLEIYAPWCKHCLELEPTYNKLAKHLRGIDSIVVAKMDGTTNEHARIKVDGFPTFLFFPAGNKSSEPITIDSDGTLVEMYKYLKKHASIPFKLHKPDSSVDAHATKRKKSSSNDDVKDEL